jgi:non-specific serine/threonine protein kinase
LNDYPNGVWFVALDSLSDPALVAQTIASVFGIREGSSDRPLLERLIYALRAKTTLLILDNCEHVLDDCAQLIKTLLTNCSSLKILTTSREILNMEGEAIHDLQTLSLPEDRVSLETITEYEAIQLFTERAALTLSSFRLTNENAQTIVDICRRVGGIPLAIEMAAARVDILSVNEILKQLNHFFELLVGKSRSALSRHQTMRASMDWSWGLLTEAEQRFMRQLSVFAGGWTLDSAQAVCEGDTLNLTGALVKKSLIRVKQEAEGETRYQFHEIVRQYAYEKLVESGEEDIRTRHLKYFLGLSELAEPALRGPAQIEWMSRLNDERDNIRAALAWANRTDVEAGLYISSRFGRFWESFDIREGSYWLSTFLKKPESQAYPRTRAMALYSHLPILNYLNEVDTLRSTAKECLELCHAFGYQSVEVDILLISAGEIPSAAQRMELFQQALNLAQASGDIWWQARTLHQVGWNYGDKERLAYWERAITLFRQAGDWRELAQCLATFAHFVLLNDDLELAQKCLDEATLLNDQLKNKEARAIILSVRTQIAMMRGDYKQAHIYLQEGIGITEELGARMSSLWGRSWLGYLTLREGKLSEARDIFTETGRAFFNDKNEIGVVFNLEGFAGLYATVEEFRASARLIGWADATREKIHDSRPRLEQANVDKIIAACLAKMGEVEFSDAYEEGQKMTLDEAVAYALNES